MFLEQVAILSCREEISLSNALEQLGSTNTESQHCNLSLVLNAQYHILFTLLGF